MFMEDERIQIGKQLHNFTKAEPLWQLADRVWGATLVTRSRNMCFMQNFYNYWVKNTFFLSLLVSTPCYPLKLPLNTPTISVHCFFSSRTAFSSYSVQVSNCSLDQIWCPCFDITMYIWAIFWLGMEELHWQAATVKSKKTGLEWPVKEAKYSQRQTLLP